MKIKSNIAIAILAAGVTLAGCSTKPEGGIPVEQGLFQVGRGLASMKLGELTVLTNSVFHGRTNFATGLFASDFSYTFNVTTSKSDSNSLSIEADTAVPQSPVSGKLADTYTSSSSRNRANQITINFTSPFFTTTTITTTNKQTVGTNVVTSVETKVERTITDPKKLSDFLNVVKSFEFTPAGGEMMRKPDF
jgi:hypothetical protein